MQEYGPGVVRAGTRQQVHFVFHCLCLAQQTFVYLTLFFSLYINCFPPLVNFQGPSPTPSLSLAEDAI